MARDTAGGHFFEEFLGIRPPGSALVFDRYLRQDISAEPSAKCLDVLGFHRLFSDTCCKFTIHHSLPWIDFRRCRRLFGVVLEYC